jgi:hypothetical protein
MVRNIRWSLTIAYFFFLSVGIWWIICIITLSPNNIFHKESEKDYTLKDLENLGRLK